jgi:hypothetical protein
MFSIPPIVLLYLSGAILLFIGFFSLANIVSLARYGAADRVGYFATLVYVIGAAVIVFVTWRMLPAIDWSAPVQLLAAPRLF